MSNYRDILIKYRFALNMSKKIIAGRALNESY